MDLIFNFNRASYILDEFILGGRITESSWKCALLSVLAADEIEKDLLPKVNPTAYD